MRVGSLFSGIGGIELALRLAVPSSSVAWLAENAKPPSRVLAARFPYVKNWGDVTEVDWRKVEPVDVLVGGFPCQDLSHAGNVVGLGGSRSGLWSSFAEAIAVLSPRWVLIENVIGIASAKAASQVQHCPRCVGDDATSVMRALGYVLADLAVCGLDASWIDIRADDAGAPHRRRRVFVLATRRPLADAITFPFHQHRDAARVVSTPRRRLPTYGHPPWASAGRDIAVNHDGRAADTRGVHAGPYEPAVAGWERLTRPAPPMLTEDEPGMPTVRFVEWLMGFPDGWVADVDGISEPQAHTMLGNAVVPYQAALAITALAEAEAI